MGARQSGKGLSCGCVLCLVLPAVFLGAWLALGMPLPGPETRSLWLERSRRLLEGVASPGDDGSGEVGGRSEEDDGLQGHVEPDGTLVISGHGSSAPEGAEAEAGGADGRAETSPPDPIGTPPPPEAGSGYVAAPYTGKYAEQAHLGGREPTGFELPPEEVTDRNLYDISRRHKVTRVVAPGGETLTDRGVGYLAWLPRLNHLDLRGCSGITGFGVASLGGCIRLETLHLGGSRVRTPIDDRGAAALGAIDELGVLSIVHAEVGDVGVAGISRARRLTDLDLSGNPLISDHAAASLRGHGNLRRLDLSGSGVTDRGVADLAWIPTLRRLALVGTAVGGSGFAAFRGHSNLAEVDLSGSQVDDLGLSYLAAIGSLRSLGLRRTAITGLGLERLLGATGLAELDLTGCDRLDSSALRTLGRFVQLRSLRLPADLAASAEELGAALPRCEIR